MAISEVIAVGGVAASYLAGSIPFGVLVARSRGVDIRQVGSGNTGATNVGRALGRRWGMLVFCLDFLKGLFPVLAARFGGPRLGAGAFFEFDLPVLCALAAVLGHVFSVWLGFRGGKAGATGLGAGAVLSWPAMLAGAAVWLVIVAVSRYVSLGTILGGVGYVVAYVVRTIVFQQASPFDREHVAMTIFCAFVVALVVFRHKDNIKRLLAGTESKVELSRGS